MISHTILIVDDDPDIRETLSLITEAQGYSVRAARDGAEALGMLRNGEVTPCLILLDLMMPVLSGDEFLEEQRKDPSLRAIPVIVLSGDPNARQRIRDLKLELLTKPVDYAILIAAIKRNMASAEDRR